MSCLIFLGVFFIVVWVYWMFNVSLWILFWIRFMRILIWVMLLVWSSLLVVWFISILCVRRRFFVGVFLRIRLVFVFVSGDFLLVFLEEGILSFRMLVGIYWCVVFLNLWIIWYRFSVIRLEVVVWFLLYWIR